MAIDIKAYMTQLAKEAGVAEDKLQAALEVVSNEKVSKAFSDAMLRQEDYSRNMDALTGEKKKLTQWYQEQLSVAQKNEQIVTDYDAKVKKYQELYGDITDGTPGRSSSVDTSNFIDKKTFEERLNQQGQQAIQITKIATRCATDYYARFQKVLDIDALEKFTLESGLPLQAAYDKFIEPQVNEIKEASFAEKLKKAREEGIEEGRSKVSNPTDPGPSAPNGFMGNLLKKPDGAPNARASFVDAWNGAASKQ